MAARQPLTVEVTRGDMVESRHRAAAVVMDGAGKTPHSWGDVGRLVYPRSAIKPLQTLALIETGAVEHFRLSDAEIALASASHNGTPAHTGAVDGWLARVGLSERDLECGAHPPMDEEAARDLVRAGRAPGPLHNNCSGKHAGFLTTARHMGEPTAGYVKAGHPVQERLKEILGQMGGADLARAPTGIDGCGIPVYGMALAGLARALLRAGKTPGPVCNNCSGKHAGFLTTARHFKEPTKGYSGIGHPVQTRLRKILVEMGGADLRAAPTGIDGCGIPVYGMPLSAMARALARMADPAGLGEKRRAAARRIVAAMTAHPDLVAGPGRFDTLAMQAAPGAFAVKGGAEGVYAAILPSLGLGVALKIDDGAKRAAEVAMAAILNSLGVLSDKQALELLEAPVLNAAGSKVGVVRMEAGWNA